MGWRSTVSCLDTSDVRAWRRCWRRSGCRLIMRTAIHTSSAAGNDSASLLAARWQPSRNSWWRTSQCRRSTCRCRRKCWHCSLICARGLGWRCCSSAMTCRSCAASATGSSCCISVASWRKVRRPQCWKIRAIRIPERCFRRCRNWMRHSGDRASFYRAIHPARPTLPPAACSIPVARLHCRPVGRGFHCCDRWVQTIVPPASATILRALCRRRNEADRAWLHWGSARRDRVARSVASAEPHANASAERVLVTECAGADGEGRERECGATEGGGRTKKGAHRGGCAPRSWGRMNGRQRNGRQAEECSIGATGGRFGILLRALAAQDRKGEMRSGGRCHVFVIWCRLCPGWGAFACMRQISPFRDRIPAQLCEQARACRKSAEAAGPQEAAMLLRSAERYETMADLKEGPIG